MSFIDYLASVPALKLDRLYESPWTCQAVLRSLPPISKQYVLRLLYIDTPVEAGELEVWIRPEFASKHKVAIERLEHLRVLLSESNKTYRLNPVYQKSLRDGLSQSAQSPKEEAVVPKNLKLPSTSELSSFSLNQWEYFLLQLVSFSGQGSSSLPRNSLLTKIFAKAELLSSGEMRTITEKGFQFLLKDINSQLWQVLREFMAIHEETEDSTERISFLLELGFFSVGNPYDLSSLSPESQNFLVEIETFGLVRIVKAGRSTFFVPTPLAAAISAGLSESATWQSSEGNVVVETNFRVYAYTTSRLQAEILKIFTRVEYKLPNLVVGALTRESCNNAFSCGISADQIVSYLLKHAHPAVANKKPAVPENVTDQIRLWEHDRNRVQTDQAILYFDFPSKEAFKAVAQYARDTEALLWSSPKEERLVVRDSAHDQVRAFIRKLGTSAPKKK